MKYFFSILLFVLFSELTQASTIKKDSLASLDTEIFQAADVQMEIQANGEVKFKRGKAIIFTVLTGFLGGHRIYMGTHQRTPIIYSVTFGGFGILPIIDLLHLIFKKDISVYENKSQIIMWRDN
ncbi:MAG TPA: TM2 domain-containing protein [Vicingaceae bacterium]|jgi:hypothetical protein|nr:TM2 domain-containing protein [Vicingaceae bacterium]